jgi:hypothetical protein
MDREPKDYTRVHYGEDYFGRNSFPDAANTANSRTIIEYGGPGSPNTNNRTLQEIISTCSSIEPQVCVPSLLWRCSFSGIGVCGPSFIPAATLSCRMWSDAADGPWFSS